MLRVLVFGRDHWPTQSREHKWTIGKGGYGRMHVTNNIVASPAPFCEFIWACWPVPPCIECRVRTVVHELDCDTRRISRGKRFGAGEEQLTKTI